MSEKKTNSFKNSLIFPALLLGLFTLVASAMLSSGDLGTRDAIAERLAEDLQASISQVIPEDIHDNNLLEDTLRIAGPDGAELTVYQAKMGGEVAAVAFTVGEFGYSGLITSIIGIDRNGKILGVRILSHTETPGLGDKVEIAKDDWVLDFSEKSLGDPLSSQWLVKKDGGYFDQFSGATITPRAVVKSVKKGLEFFEAQKEVLLTASNPAQEVM